MTEVSSACLEQLHKDCEQSEPSSKSHHQKLEYILHLHDVDLLVQAVSSTAIQKDSTISKLESFVENYPSNARLHDLIQILNKAYPKKSLKDLIIRFLTDNQTVEDYLFTEGLLLTFISLFEIITQDQHLKLGKAIESILEGCTISVKKGFWTEEILDRSILESILPVLNVIVQSSRDQEAIELLENLQSNLKSHPQTIAKIAKEFKKEEAQNAWIFQFLARNQLSNASLQQVFAERNLDQLYTKIFEPWNDKTWLEIVQKSLEISQKEKLISSEDHRKALFFCTQALGDDQKALSGFYLFLNGEGADLNSLNQASKSLELFRYACHQQAEGNSFAPIFLSLINRSPNLAKDTMKVLRDETFPTSLVPYLIQCAEACLMADQGDLFSYSPASHFETILGICKKDHSFLNKLIRLESLTGASFINWIQDDFSHEPIDFLLEHSAARKAILKKLPVGQMTPFGIITYKQFKLCVMENPRELARLFDIFEESYDLIRAGMNALRSEEGASIVHAFTRLDPEITKRFSQELTRLAEILLPQNYTKGTRSDLSFEKSQNLPLVKQLLELLEKGEFDLFQEVLGHFNLENQDQIECFLNKQKELPITFAGQATMNLWKAKHLKIALILSALPERADLEPYYKKIIEAPTHESLASLLHHLISLSEDKDLLHELTALFAGGQLSLETSLRHLDIDELQALLKICLLKPQNPELRHVLFKLASDHAPNAVLKFIKLLKKDQELALTLARLIETVPEATMKLLEAGELQPERMKLLHNVQISDPVKAILPLHEDVLLLLESQARSPSEVELILTYPHFHNRTLILRLFLKNELPENFLRDPEWGALIELNDLIYTLEIPISKESLAALQLFPKLSSKYVNLKQRITLSKEDASSIKNIEELIKRYVSERDFISKLLILQSQNKTALVRTLLEKFPSSTKTALDLADLAVAGYDKEVLALLERESEPFIQALLKVANHMQGAWIQAALQLDPSKDGVLIEAMIKAPLPLSPLLTHLVYLALSGDRDITAHFVNGLPETAPVKDRVLAQWISKGELTQAREVWGSDLLYQENSLYKQIRNKEDSRLQDQLLALFLSGHQQDLQFALTFCKEGTPLDLQRRRLARLHYLLIHAPQEIQTIISQPLQKGEDAIDQLFIQMHPAKQIDASIKSESDFYKPESKKRYLAEQKAFSVQAAKSLLMTNGGINLELIAEVKKSSFYEKQRSSQSTVFQFLEWTFDILSTKGEFSARLAAGVVEPPPSGPSAILLRKSLKLGDNGQLSKRDAQAGILSCLLQRPWQSRKVGSCFGTSVVIRSHHSEWQLRQTLDDYILMVKKGRLSRLVEGGSREFPVIVHPSILKKSLIEEHPLSKAREYLISSMNSYGDSKLKATALKVFFGPVGIVFSYLSEEALKSREDSKTAHLIDSLFKKKFIESTIELFDPLASSQGALTITDRSSLTLLNTKEAYQAFLLKLLEEVERDALNQASHLSASIEKQIQILKIRIESGKFLEAAQSKYKAHGLESSLGREGGEGKIAEEIYNGLEKNSLLFSNHISEAETDFKLLLSYVQNLPDCIKVLRSSQPYLGVFLANSVHAFTLFPKPLLDALENSSAEQLVKTKKAEAVEFGNRKLTVNEKEEIEKALLNYLTEPLRSQFSNQLKKHPSKNLTVRGYSLELLNALMECLNTTKDFKNNKSFIESIILNMDFLKSARPSHLVCGDLNYHHANNSSHYAFAASYFDGKIQHYQIKKDNLTPLLQKPGIEIGLPVPEPYWKPTA